MTLSLACDLHVPYLLPAALYTSTEVTAEYVLVKHRRDIVGILQEEDSTKFYAVNVKYACKG